jgi:hypothetical protein
MKIYFDLKKFKEPYENFEFGTKQDFKEWWIGWVFGFYKIDFYYNWRLEECDSNIFKFLLSPLRISLILVIYFFLFSIGLVSLPFNVLMNIKFTNSK